MITKCFWHHMVQSETNMSTPSSNTHIGPYLTGVVDTIKCRLSNIGAVGEPVRSEPIMSRQDLFARIVSTVLSLAASAGIAYYGMKWLSKALDPTSKEKESARKKAQNMLQKLGVRDIKLTDYELCVAANLVDPLHITVSWDDIGGLDDVVQQLNETVIFPLRRSDLFLNSVLLRPPKGVLLYGPPGCGKTMVAKATAKAAGARFINLQVSTLVDKWYGESQKRVEAIFSLAQKLQPTIIFIDEIDSLMRSRSSQDHEATAMMKTQFMSLWDGMISDLRYQVIIIGATNRPRDVDSAILRRMPCMFQITKPAKEQRKNILQIILQNEQVADLDLNRLAELTGEFTGSDLKEACRLGAVYTVKDLIQLDTMQDTTSFEQLRCITMADIERGIARVRESKHLAINELTLD